MGGTQWLRRILAEYITDIDERRSMQRLIVADPNLWRLLITVRDPRGGFSSMYEAIVEVDGREIRRRADSGEFRPLGPFLLWRRLDEAQIEATLRGLTLN